MWILGGFLSSFFCYLCNLQLWSTLFFCQGTDISQLWYAFFIFFAAFEELERALSIAQKTEEARKKLQAEMDEKIKAVEKASEEERVNLQRELTRVKQEVVEIMKVKSETHLELLAFNLIIQLQLNYNCKIY